MPQLGFGVFQVSRRRDHRRGQPRRSRPATGASTRLPSTATRPEPAARSRSPGSPAEDLFVTSKLWIDDLGYEPALAAFDASLDKLGLDYLDLYLIHWPAPASDQYVDSWLALEKLLADGRVRAIGVSNFQPDHLQRLIDLGGMVPAVNQVELHPALQQRAVDSVQRGPRHRHRGLEPAGPGCRAGRSGRQGDRRPARQDARRRSFCAGTCSREGSSSRSQ